MRTFKLTLAYDGTGYLGWQIQPGRVTVQGTLEDRLFQITGESIRVTASGRTDAGVHALGQVVSFHSQTELPLKDLQRALNARLPDDIVVRQVEYAADDFFALRHTLRKRYGYTLHDGPLRPVLERHRCWHVFHRLDADKMHAAAQVLLGRHDFAGYATKGSKPVTTTRTVYEVNVERGRGGEPDWVRLEIEADGFLYNMVRNIVGTLYQIGRGRRPLDWAQEVLLGRNRSKAGLAAPAQGLTLLGVICRDDPEAAALPDRCATQSADRDT